MILCPGSELDAPVVGQTPRVWTPIRECVTCGRQQPALHHRFEHEPAARRRRPAGSGPARSPKPGTKSRRKRAGSRGLGRALRNLVGR